MTLSSTEVEAYDRFPLELWEEIVCYFPDSDRATLKALSESARGLSALAQRRLFRTIAIRLPEHALQICNAIVRSPELARSILSIDLHWETETDEAGTEALCELMSRAEYAKLLKIKGSFEKVVLFSKIGLIVFGMGSMLQSFFLVNLKVQSLHHLFLALTTRGLAVTTVGDLYYMIENPGNEPAEQLNFKNCIAATSPRSPAIDYLTTLQNKHGQLRLTSLEVVDCLGVSTTLAQFLDSMTEKEHSPWSVERLYFREEINSLQMERIVVNQRDSVMVLAAGVQQRSRSFTMEELFFTVMDAHWRSLKKVVKAEIDIEISPFLKLMITMSFKEGNLGFIAEERKMGQTNVKRASVGLDNESEVWRALSMACDYAYSACSIENYIERICYEDSWQPRVELVGK
ncbi:hypothetical protein VKT23_004640 [Stygiomarasmius scandens]|uniref:F-box domain-containing protein n=1 Tax=Marasmiellus scandens TaxID=2682957 RepID=A0ABR1JX82_9AGAR